MCRVGGFLLLLWDGYHENGFGDRKTVYTCEFSLSLGQIAHKFSLDSTAGLSVFCPSQNTSIYCGCEKG
jgi:hypothetical protein